MRRSPAPRFHTPVDLPQTLELLRDLPASRPIAGGTDLAVLMKDRLAAPADLISLDRVEELRLERCTADGTDLGAMVPLRRLERRPEIQQRYPALIGALRSLAAPPIRNQATLGGNVCLDTKCIYYNQSRRWPRAMRTCFKAGGEICHVAPAGTRCFAALAADTAVPLLLCGAELSLRSAETTRRIPMAAFFTGDGLRPHDLGAGELLTHIHLPPPGKRSAVGCRRFAYRKALDFSQLNAGASVTLDSAGRVTAARMVIGAIGPAPVEVSESLRCLLGERPCAELWRAAAQAVPKEAVRAARSPRLTPFLQSVLRAHAERVLAETCSRASEAEA